MILAKPSLTLAEFLDLPETKPANEYIDGDLLQKPMPKTKHSRLQLKLCNAINDVTESDRIAYAFPELRCNFGNRSIVPDVTILLWSNIQWDESGEPFDDVTLAPDWIIEILSPDQRSNRVSNKILHSLKHGTQLGWMLDPLDHSILVFLPNQLPLFCEGSDRLPVLAPIPLELTCETIFGWLKMNVGVI
jgi:Uma2 family endonuclease